MEFGKEKCVMLIMDIGKRETTETLEVLNQESIKQHLKKKKTSNA